MAVALPVSGVNLQAQNSEKFIRDLKSASDATKSFVGDLDKAEKSSTGAGRGLSFLGSKIGGFGGTLLSMAGDAADAHTEVTSFFSSLPAGTASIAAVTAGVAAFATAFVGLGLRGASLVGIADSFDRLTRSIGVNGVEVLADLRIAARGAVSDFALLTQANVALSGATGEFGKQFGAALPQILRIAQAQANATGESVEYLFESLVGGVKRASPRLIDNTGLVLNLTAANEAYAESIGKTVSQLTAEEQQIALLNALLSTGAGAIAAFGDQAETGADKLGRMGATFTNILDTLAIGVQPAFLQFLDVINRALSFVQVLTTAITPLISSLLELGSTLITGPLNAILSLLEPVVRLTGFFIQLITAGIQPVIEAANTFFGAFFGLVSQIVKLMGDFVNNNLGINFDNLAERLGRGAGFVFGTFARAILITANKLIFPAIIGIARFIADFLVGQSPPPKGPLSQIDKGGAAVMQAWLEGFTAVPLTPVETVVSNVNTALGNIGKLGLPAVESRLALLDKAIQPFKDQLEIIKSRFEAIQAPADAALQAIDRQLNMALDALNQGDAQAAATIRNLDAQRAAIEKNLNLNQSVVDAAQIQLALAQASQGEERTLLEIQLARLKALQQAGKVVDATKAAQPKAAGGGAAQPSPVTGGATVPGAGFPSVSDLISGQGAVNQIGADFGAGFSNGFIEVVGGDLAEFQQNSALLGEQTARIGQADIGARITESLSGLATSLQEKFLEASAVISTFITNTFDPNTPGSIVNAFINLPTAISESISFFFTGTGEGSLSAILAGATALFANFPAEITNALSGLGGLFYGVFVTPIVGGINAAIGAIEQAINDILRGLANLFEGARGAFEATGQIALFDQITGGLSGGITLPRIPVPAPPAVPGARQGGSFSGGGLLQTHGNELLALGGATKLDVFPAGATRALDFLGRVLAQPMSVSIPQRGGDTTNNTQNWNNTFYGQGDAGSTRQRFAMMRGMGGG